MAELDTPPLAEDLVDECLAAWDAGDFVRVASLSERIGVSLDEPTMRSVDSRIALAKRGVTRVLEGRRLFLQAVMAAVESDIGIGWSAGEGFKTILCLAVRRSERLFVDIGVSKGTVHSPAMAWSELRPWHQARAKNVEKCLEWAKSRSLAFGLVQRPDKKPAGPNVDVAAIERAIVQNPDDDASRAVLADALLDQGNQRGELISLQLKRAPFLVPSERGHAMQQRELALLEQFGKGWLPPSLAYARSVMYRRGLVEGLTVSASAFRKHGAEMVASAPIRRLRLVPHTPESLEILLNTAALSRIHELDLSDRAIDNADWMRLAASPFLDSLRVLDVGNSSSFAANVSEADLDVIGNTSWASKLTALRCKPAQAVLGRLAVSGEFPALERLDVGWTGEELEAFLQNRELLVLGTGGHRGSIARLLSLPGASSIVWLRCAHDSESPTVIEELATMSQLPRALRAISIGQRTALSRRDLRLLATSPVFQSLRYINPTSPESPLDEEQARALLSMQSLESIVLNAQTLSLLSSDTRVRLSSRVTLRPHTDAFDDAFSARSTDLRACAQLESAPLGDVPHRHDGPSKKVAPRRAATRVEVAQDPATQPEVLTASAAESFDLFKAVLTNPNAPSEALACVFSHKAPATVLASVALHKNASAALLDQLLQSKFKTVRVAVAGNRNISADALERVIAEGLGWCGAYVEYPNLTTRTLLTILQRSGEATWHQVAQQQRLSEETRALLLTSTHSKVLAAIAARSDTSPETLRALAASHASEGHIVNAIAQNPNTPLPTLVDLTDQAINGTPEPFARDALLFALAQNASVTDQLLIRIFDSLGDGVNRRPICFAIARNLRTPAEVLTAIAAQFPGAVAANPRAPSHVLADISVRSPELLETLAANPAVPISLVERALSNETPTTRYAAASNPTLAGARLEGLAASPDEHTRAGVAANPSCSAATFERLLADSSPRVWIALAKNANASPAIHAELLARAESEQMKELLLVLENNQSNKPTAT
ncbi:MAG: TIGR02996 domain-containing protein [Polyangiaceae bacterium]